MDNHMTQYSEILLPEKTNICEIDRLIRMQEITEISGKSKSAINRDVAEGTFPAPLRIGKRAVAWKASHIAKWMNELETTVSMEG
jgi:prophage regulatory protein